jgi:hypothetical protein
LDSRARNHRERLFATDAAFAPHTPTGDCIRLLSTPNLGISLEAALPIMRPAAMTALQLDPLLANIPRWGWLYSYDLDWANAEKAFPRAIELNPSLMQTCTSYSLSTLQPLGKTDEALRLL